MKLPFKIPVLDKLSDRTLELVFMVCTVAAVFMFGMLCGSKL